MRVSIRLVVNIQYRRRRPSYLDFDSKLPCHLATCFLFHPKETKTSFRLAKGQMLTRLGDADTGGLGATIHNLQWQVKGLLERVLIMEYIQSLVVRGGLLTGLELLKVPVANLHITTILI